MSENHGAVWWTELMTRDVEAAKSYYGKICGWTFETMPMESGDYTVAYKGDTMVTGLLDMSGIPGMEEVPPHWFSYFAVDDVDAASTETENIGGKVARAAFDVPSVGRIAIIEDPTGAMIGLMTPAPGAQQQPEAPAA